MPIEKLESALDLGLDRAPCAPTVAAPAAPDLGEGTKRHADAQVTVLDPLMTDLRRFELFGVRGITEGQQVTADDLAAATAQAALARARYRAIIDRINYSARAATDAASGSNGRLTVVLVADLANVQFARTARALTKAGVATYLLHVGTLPETLENFFRASVTELVIIESYVELGAVLGAVRPDIVHVVNFVTRYPLGSLVMRWVRDARVVVQPYDIATIRGTREDLAHQLAGPVLDLDLRCERDTMTGADGLVHRMRPSIDRELEARHGKLAPTLHFAAYPLAELAVFLAGFEDGDDFERAQLPPPGGAPIRLVHASGFPAPIPHNDRGMAPFVSLPEVFRSLLEQGFAIDAVQSPSSPRDFSANNESFRPLYDLTQNTPRFRLTNGWAPDELAPRIRHHHFGINLCHISRAARLSSSQRMNAVGTTVFGYIEAGLPIIASREFRYQTELIEDHGIGTSVSEAEIGNLAPIVRALDYGRLKRNIRRFLAEHALEDEIGNLVRFYRGLLAQEPRAGRFIQH